MDRHGSKGHMNVKYCSGSFVQGLQAGEDKQKVISASFGGDGGLLHVEGMQPPSYY